MEIAKKTHFLKKDINNKRIDKKTRAAGSFGRRQKVDLGREFLGECDGGGPHISHPFLEGKRKSPFFEVLSFRCRHSHGDMLERSRAVMKRELATPCHCPPGSPLPPPAPPGGGKMKPIEDTGNSLSSGASPRAHPLPHYAHGDPAQTACENKPP